MKKKLIDSVRVKDPCAESWDGMSGNDRVRFCSHCAKNVNDISRMTRREALQLVRRSGGSLCVRYLEHPVTKAPLFSEQLTQITRRRAPLMAAGVVGASLSLASLTYAQGGPAPAAVRPAAATVAECEDKIDPKRSAPTGSGSGVLRGTVVDPQGAVVINVPISLLDAKGVMVSRTTSDDNGEFRFERLERGTYAIRTQWFSGFAPGSLPDIAVDDGERSVTLELPIGTTMGVVVVVPAQKGFQSLSIAVDELAEARDMIARGDDLNRREDDGTTPIFVAVESGDIELVRLLLDHGAKVNVRNEERETPLMMINEDTTVEIVELLLNRGAKVNRVAKDGDTALIRAAREAKPEVLLALIRAGADLNVQNEDGMTALMAAAEDENLENVRVLLEAGADVNLRDSEGDNAWDYTAEKEIEDLLVSYGVILDPEDLEETEQPEATTDRSDEPN